MSSIAAPAGNACSSAYNKCYQGQCISRPPLSLSLVRTSGWKNVTIDQEITVRALVDLVHEADDDTPFGDHAIGVYTLVIEFDSTVFNVLSPHILTTGSGFYQITYQELEQVIDNQSSPGVVALSAGCGWISFAPSSATRNSPSSSSRSSAGTGQDELATLARLRSHRR